MARKNPVPEREQQICQRLLDFRRTKKMSRQAMAEELGIKATRLQNYEVGRAPLPFRFAANFCRAFDINPAWLAEGDGSVYGGVIIDPKLDSEIKPRQLFSCVYDGIIKPIASAKKDTSLLESTVQKIKPQLSAKGIGVEFQKVVGAIDAPAILALLQRTLSPTVRALPPTLRLVFYRHLIASSDAFEQKHSKEIIAFAEHSETGESSKFSSALEKMALTNVTTIGNNEDVKAQLPALLKRLNEATLERGTKTALAKFMGVPLPKVSQWLSGAHEPGGETTLQLLHWVEQQERNK